MIGLIYEHRNKLNNKRYVGQTIQTIEARKREGYFNTKFARALDKYGWENFDTNILVELENENKSTLIEQLNIIEEIIIMRDNLQDDQFGYNIKSGGLNNTFRHTPEAIEKIRITSMKPNKGQFQKGSTAWKLRANRPISEEHKRKVSEGLKRAYTDGSRKAWNKGEKMSEEIRKKISKANRGRIVGQYPTHMRWHVSRGITSPNCSFCGGLE